MNPDLEGDSIRESFRIYPIQRLGFENVRFNHAKKHWGANFSTVEIGRARLQEFFVNRGAKVFEYRLYSRRSI